MWFLLSLSCGQFVLTWSRFQVSVSLIYLSDFALGLFFVFTSSDPAQT